MEVCNCGKHVVPAAQVVPVNCEFVIPGQYPYVRPVVDSYTCCCCGTVEPAMKDYPTAGPFQGSAFALDNAMPYLIDSTYMSYGQALTFAENIYTKVTKRDDPSCINLTARFDFTDSTLTNTVRFDFLKNYTARKYEELSGVLPIIKSGIKFRIHYTVLNIDGGIEYEGHADCKVDQSHFHFTSIKDVFVQSTNGLIIENIPAMTYQGRYTFVINRVEAIVEVINTKEHLQDPSLNPYYTFTDNNRKILLHNTEISQETADDILVIGVCDVRQSFEYIANVTTRLRINFIAFTTLPIACGDTSPIWFALNEPTEATITQLRNEVSALEDEVAALHAKDASQDAVIEQLAGQVELNKNNIIALTNELNAEKARNDQQDQLISTLISRIDALTSRVSILEAIPRALVTYKADKEFQSAQITWKGYGNLYQATEDFTASGIFDADVANGHLIPVATSAADLTAVLERVEAVETTANAASETASTASESVNAISETVSGLNTTVEVVQSDITTINERINNVEEEIEEIDVSKLSVTEYEKGSDYPRGRIVYVTPGQLYQAIHAFRSNNDPSFTLQESLEADITAENLVPVTDSDVSELDARVNAIETWQETINSDIQELNTKVDDAEEAEFYTSSASFPSTGEVGKMYIDKSTGRSYTSDPENRVYQLMNTNNIVDGSIVNTTI